MPIGKDAWLVLLEAEQVVAAFFLDDQPGVFVVGVEGVAADGAVQQIDFIAAQELAGGGGFTGSFFVRGSAGRELLRVGGDGDGDFLLDVAEGHDEAEVLADGFGVDREVGGEVAAGLAQPEGEDAAEGVEVQIAEQGAEGLLRAACGALPCGAAFQAGCLAPLGSQVGRL